MEELHSEITSQSDVLASELLTRLTEASSIKVGLENNQDKAKRIRNKFRRYFGE